ncbi:MAG: hypothetical protein QXU32_00635 [Nitrososphaerales archaeon]
MSDGNDSANKNDQMPKPEHELFEKALNIPEDAILPWEDVILPSKGLYYDGMVPDGRVQVRPMGLYAEKILATQRLAQTGKSLDWLFKKCVKFPSDKFDPINLLAGDRIFLLYYLRGITHGNIYEFAVRCTNEDCGQMTTGEYDLNQLASTIKYPKEELGKEPFKIVLPHLSKVLKSEFWVKVRFLRGYDMQYMLTNRKAVKKLGRYSYEQIDDTLEDNLSMLIVEAMGVSDRNKIKELVQKLHSLDTSAIREFLQENTPGIDTTITVTCEHCGNDMKMDLPITESFFRPAKRRGSGE